MTSSLSSLLALFLLCPAPLSVAQPIADIQRELRRLGCTAAHCMSPLTCMPAQAESGMPTDFGSIACVPESPFNQLTQLHLDGRRVALGAPGADSALTLPAGSTLKNVSVTHQPHLVRMDFSALTALDDLQVAHNAALVALVAAGGCLRIFSNPRLAFITFASTLMTKVIQLTDLPELVTVDLSALGEQFRELSVVSLASLTNLVGIRGRSLEQLTLVNNSLLASADELDASLSVKLNVSANPRLGGVCRVRAAPTIGACSIDSACLFAADACLGQLPSNCTRMQASSCVAGVAPRSACAVPTHRCPPSSLRFTLLASSALAKATDIPVCVSVSASAAIPRSGASFACTVKANSTDDVTFSVGGGPTTCKLEFGGRSASAVRSFFATSDTTQLSMQRTSGTVPTDQASDCGNEVRITTMGDATAAPIRVPITSVIEFIPATGGSEAIMPPTSAGNTFPPASTTAGIGGNSSAANSTLDANSTTIGSASTPSNSSGGMDVGMIVGIVIGVVCFVLAVLLIAWIVKKRRSDPMRASRHRHALSRDMGTFKQSYFSEGEGARQTFNHYDTVPVAVESTPIPSSYTNLPMQNQNVNYDMTMEPMHR